MSKHSVDKTETILLEESTKISLPIPIRENENFIPLTRRQVADAVGVDHSTISRWEKKGLIAPAQRFNGMCLYTHTDLEKIKIVAELQKQATYIDESMLCSICHRRKARVGSVVCSRCSMTNFRESLRSTLPGMETVVTNDEGTESSPEYGYYSRRAVADKVGVSPTTIFRWENKGLIPKPEYKNNQCVYSEEVLQKIIEYSKSVPENTRTPLQRAAKLSTKSFGGKIERVVGRQIRNISGRGIL